VVTRQFARDLPCLIRINGKESSGKTDGDKILHAYNKLLEAANGEKQFVELVMELANQNLGIFLYEKLVKTYTEMGMIVKQSWQHYVDITFFKRRVFHRNTLDKRKRRKKRPKCVIFMLAIFILENLEDSYTPLYVKAVIEILLSGNPAINNLRPQEKGHSAESIGKKKNTQNESQSKNSKIKANRKHRRSSSHDFDENISIFSKKKEEEKERQRRISNPEHMQNNTHIGKTKKTKKKKDKSRIVNRTRKENSKRERITPNSRHMRHKSLSARGIDRDRESESEEEEFRDNVNIYYSTPTFDLLSFVHSVDIDV